MRSVQYLFYLSKTQKQKLIFIVLRDFKVKSHIIKIIKDNIFNFNILYKCNDHFFLLFDFIFNFKNDKKNCKLKIDIKLL